jgi:hypothetical protein
MIKIVVMSNTLDITSNLGLYMCGYTLHYCTFNYLQDNPVKGNVVVVVV